MAKVRGLVGAYNPRRISKYVPGMQFAAGVDQASGFYNISFGSPSVASATAILLAPGALTSGAAATFTTMTGALLDTIDAPFGRNITVTGTSTRVLTVRGRDYLGQPMAEAITMSTGTISGKKAFKWIDSLSFSAVADTVNPTVGVGDVLGLPWATVKVLSETSYAVSTGVATVQTVGTFVVADFTSPATATTGDPRGTYDPTATLSAGVTEIVIQAVADGQVATTTGLVDGLTSETQGLTIGLHGVKQYYA